jgi:predicted nuclease of restriction endonuclease-like (RecB) superfamily
MAQISIIKTIFPQIKTLLQEARKAVVQTVNTTMVFTYFEIGKIIVEYEQQGEKRAEYGKETLKQLGQELTKEFGKGFSYQNLDRMRVFYKTYSNFSTLSRNLENQKILPKNSKTSQSSKSSKILPISQNSFTLSWSHYVFLMRIKNKDERNFYEKESQINNWSLRELKRQFNSALFERIALSTDKKGVLKDNLKKYHAPEKPEDIVKDPYILEFLGLEKHEKYSENEIEQAIIDNLENFLLEMGKGFAFIGRQQRFTFDEKHFFVDLVFYNRLLRCFVIIDLKIGEVSHQDLGQMQMYVNYYDRFVKTDEENKTIGIVLCKEKNKTLVEITLPEDNKQIFASEYEMYLPSREELVAQVEQAEQNFLNNQK